MKHANIIIIFILGIILTGCSAEDILFISNNVTSTTTNNITYNITNNITNNFTVNETKFPINLTTIEDGNIVNVRICLYNDTCYNDSFIDSTGGGGGFTADQNLNTTANVTFNNVTATNLLGNLNWSYLQNIPSYVIDYNSQISALQSKDNAIALNLSNVNASLMNEIALQSANNITQSNQINNINTRITSAVTNYTNDNTTQAQELSNLRASNQTAGRIGTINCTAGNLLYNVTLNTSGIFGTCVADQSGSFSGQINITQVNATNTALSGQVLSYSGSNDQFTWITPSSSSSSILRNVTKTTIQTINNTIYTGLNGLNVTLDANSNYTVFCTLLTASAVATTGEQLRINFTNAPIVNITYETAVSATARTPFTANGNVGGYLFADTGSGGTNVMSPSFINGRIGTGATASLVTYELKSEIISSAVRVLWGSECKYEKYT